MRILMLATLVASATAVAVGYGWLWWKSARLVRACLKQGIQGISLSLFQTAAYADRWSWELLKNVQHYEKIFYVKSGQHVRLVVLDPVTVQHVLTLNASCYEKASFVKILEILGNGVFSASGNDWMNQRQLLSPTFFMRELKDNFGIIKATVKDYLECLCTHDTAVVDVHKIFSTLAVKLIYQVAFGESLDDKSAFMVYKRFDNYLHQRKHAFCGPFFNLFGFRWKSWGSVEDETYLLRVIRELVSTRRQRSSSQCTKAKLAIDILIEDLERCEKSGSNVVLDNSATLLLAGHETTANLVTWAVYLLGTHLNLQDEARLEVQGIKDLDMKNVSQLKVLGMILWETLRLYPPQPLIGRRCIEDNTVNGVFVPKDMEVIIPVSAIHRSVDLWGHDSEDFKPYRFANGINKAYRVPSSFLPFGSGPRTCIGQSLALLEAKTILYYMLKHYSWEISPGYQHFPDVTLTLLPRFGMPILLFRL